MPNLDTPTDVRITLREGYLHITHPDNFVLLSEDLDTLWTNLARACKQYKCFRVLNEGKLDVSKMRAFDSYQAGSFAGEIRGLRMACLFENFIIDEKAEFMKTVASNRGAIIEFFEDRAAALEWLGVTEKK